MSIVDTGQDQSKSETHSFILVLGGHSKITNQLENAFLAANLDDPLLFARDGNVFLDFDRDAGTFEEAVAGAIAEVEALGIRVEGIEISSSADVASRDKE